MPSLNADTATRADGLSTYAQDWMEYTCCQIMTQDLRGCIASAWLWLQVCSTAMSRATGESYRLDRIHSNPLNFTNGPLHMMGEFCPRDLPGGELTEWGVIAFFPVCMDVSACRCVRMQTTCMYRCTRRVFICFTVPKCTSPVR